MRKNWDSLTDVEREERIWICIQNLGLQPIRIKDEKVEGWPWTPEEAFLDTFVDLNSRDLCQTDEEIKRIGKEIFEKMKVA